MVSIMGTLGFRPDTILPTIRSTEGLQRVVVFHSDHVRSREAVSEVRDICEQMGLRFSHHEVPDAFNFMRVSKAIQRRDRGDEGCGRCAAGFQCGRRDAHHERMRPAGMHP